MMIALCLAFAVTQYKHGGRPSLPHFADKAYYTTDDGATFFTDSVNLIAPFDHLVRQAVRAHMFTCDSGKHRWIGYLEKYSDADLKRFDPSNSQMDFSPPIPLVRRPGAGDWVPESSKDAMFIMDPKCPDGEGAGPPQPVLPD